MSDDQPSFSGSSSRMPVTVFAPTPPAVNQTPPEIFLCPISLELMNDPVILSSGHTYDRRSIEGWFKTGKKTCPQSRRRVKTTDLIPNLVLKDHIRHWQVTYRDIPGLDLKNHTSSTLVSDLQVKLMLNDLMVESHGDTDDKSLQILKSLQALAETNDENRTLMCNSDALSVVGSKLSQLSLREEGKVCAETACAALGTMAALSVNDGKWKLTALGLSILPPLTWFLRRGTVEAKVNAVKVIECMVLGDSSLLELGAEEGLIQGLVGVLQDYQNIQLDSTACSCLRSLYAIILPKRNRRVAIEVGAVPVMIELLPGAKKEVAEGALAVLDLLSHTHTEGLVSLLEHKRAIPMLVRSIHKYTNSSTEYAMNVLHAILMTNLHPLWHVEAVNAGAIAKLLLVMQIPESNSDTKLKARELLKSLQVFGSDKCLKTMKYNDSS